MSRLPQISERKSLLVLVAVTMLVSAVLAVGLRARSTSPAVDTAIRSQRPDPVFKAERGGVGRGSEDFSALARTQSSRVERRLKRPSAVAERKASRTKYIGLSNRGALRAAKDEQPAIASEPVWSAPPTKRGERIVEFKSPTTARIALNENAQEAAGGAKSLIVQSLAGPIAVPTGEGKFAREDTSLDELSNGDGWRPARTSIASRIPRHLEDPVLLGEGEEQLAVRPARADVAGIVTAGSKVFYGNVGLDTDAVVEPTPTGASFSWLLRSPRASTSQTLDLGLSGDRRVRVLPDGSAEILRGAHPIASITPPVAYDAQQRLLPARYAVAGQGLSVEVDVTPSKVAYPIAIDPVISLPYAAPPNSVVYAGSSDFALYDEWGMTRQFTGTSSNYNRIAPYYGQFNFPNYGNYDTLAVTTRGTSPGAYGGWYFDPIRSASVVRVWWQGVRKPSTGVGLQIGIINGGGWVPQWAGYYDGATGAYIGGANSQFGNASAYTMPSRTTIQNCASSSACPASGLPNTLAYFELATGSGTPPGRFAETLGAFVYLSDNDQPTLTAYSSTPSIWQDMTSYTPSFGAHDDGLGLGSMQYDHGHTGSAIMWSDNGAGFAGMNSVGPDCDGGADDPCPADYPSPTAGQPIATIGQGQHTVTVKASDIIGHESDPQTFTVKLDQDPPDIDLSGRLGAFALDTSTLGTASPRSIVENAPFVITAHDGSTTSDSMRRSGVKTLSARVNRANPDGSEDTTGAPAINFDANGAPKQSPAACDENNGGTSNSCSLTYAGTFDAESLDPGIYYFRVTATDYLNHTSTKVFKLGVGVARIDGVSEGQTTARYVPLSVARTRGTASDYRLQYRSAPNSAWCDVPATAVQRATDATHLTSWPQGLTSGVSAKLVLDLSSLTVTTSSCSDSQLLADGELRVRALLEGSGADFTRASEDVTIAYDHGGKDTDDDSQSIGPGTVDLVTGNFSLSQTDVSIDAYKTDLTVSRTYNSRYSATDSLLGPGWSLSLPSSSDDATYTRVIDNADVTLPEEARYPTVDVVLEDGSAISFELASTPNNDGSDRYVPATGLEGLKLTRIPDAYDPARTAGFTLTDLDSGRVVGFRKPSADDGSQPGQWLATDVSDPSQPDQIRYQYSTDSPRRLLNAYSATGGSGINCGTVWTAIPRGCQVLHFGYGTPQPGGPLRLTAISLRTYDPDPNQAKMRTVDMVQYQYDSSSRLIAEWDSRITPALKSEYAYTQSGAQQLLTSVTPAGETPFSLSYSKLSEDNNDGRLASTSRNVPALGAATESVRYYIPTTTAVSSSAPFNLTEATVAAWGQPAPPWMGSAVFAPDQPPNGTPATNYDRAQISYLDPLGREVNSASPGGRLSETEYDQYGSVTRSLTAENRARAMALSNAADRLDAAQRWDTENEYEQVDGSPQARRHLTRTKGPEHQVRLDDNTWTQARTTTDYTYDQGSPRPRDYTQEPFDLVTTQTESALVGSSLQDSRTTTMTYGSSDAEWSLRTPRTTTTGSGGSATTSKVTVDNEGLVTERFQPRSQDSTQPSTTKFIYYSAAANSTYPECGGRPEWLGLPCKKLPGAQPTTAGLPKLPVQTITYNYLRQPLVSAESVVDAAGATKTRSTTKTYDAAGRVLTEEVTGNVGTALSKIEHVYSTTTGRETQTRTAGGAQTISRTFDPLGRQTNYTDATGHASSVSYDLLSRPVTMMNQRATRTNTYDPVTGDLTQVSDSGAGTFTGTYDADGRLTSTTMPGGIVKSYQLDETGTPVYIAYNRTTGCSTGCLLYDQYGVENAHGQYNGLWDTMAGQNPTNQYYDYDSVGRLTRVQDWRDDSGTWRCEGRRYYFDADSNRTQKNVSPETADDCNWGGADIVQNNTFDAADRLTNSGYTYDAFGRITTVPAADTGGTGNLTATYYVNDLARSITQNGTTQTLDLDPNLRMSVKTKTTGSTTTTETYAYTDDSDSPEWTEGGGTWNRTVDGIAGGEAVQDSASGVKLLIQNLRGDVVAQSTTAGVLSNISRVDEYGVPKTALPAGVKYAFHGSKQREALTSGGMAAMGVRLYSPQQGRFEQADSVLGGNANPYGYPNDPVNGQDLDGRRKKSKKKCWVLNKTFSGAGYGADINASWCGSGGKSSMNGRPTAVGKLKPLRDTHFSVGRTTVSTPVSRNKGTRQEFTVTVQYESVDIFNIGMTVTATYNVRLYSNGRYRVKERIDRGYKDPKPWIGRGEPV